MARRHLYSCGCYCGSSITWPSAAYLVDRGSTTDGAPSSLQLCMLLWILRYLLPDRVRAGPLVRCIERRARAFSGSRASTESRAASSRQQASGSPTTCGRFPHVMASESRGGEGLMPCSRVSLQLQEGFSTGPGAVSRGGLTFHPPGRERPSAARAVLARARRPADPTHTCHQCPWSRGHQRCCVCVCVVVVYVCVCVYVCMCVCVCVLCVVCVCVCVERCRRMRAGGSAD